MAVPLPQCTIPPSLSHAFLKGHQPGSISVLPSSQCCFTCLNSLLAPAAPFLPAPMLLAGSNWSLLAWLATAALHRSCHDGMTCPKHQKPFPWRLWMHGGHSSQRRCSGLGSPWLDSCLHFLFRFLLSLYDFYYFKFAQLYLRLSLLCFLFW